MAEEYFSEPDWTVDRLPSIAGPHGSGLNYPSVWPEGDYLLRAGEGYKVEVDEDGVAIVHSKEGMIGLDELLRKEGLTPLADRTPVLTIGSNRAPRQLHDKMAKIKDATPDDLTVPVLSIQIKGLDVVFAARPSMLGSVPAVMYGGPETENTEVDLAIAFLNDRQLERVDVTEGSVYKRVPLNGCTVEIDDKVVPVQYYQGQSAIFWDEHGPRAVSAIKAEGRTMSALNQADFYDLVLGYFKDHNGMSVLDGIYFNPESAQDREILNSYQNTPAYPHEVSAVVREGRHVGVTEKPRSAATQAVGEVLAQLGLSRTVGLPEGFVAKPTKHLRIKSNS